MSNEPHRGRMARQYLESLRAAGVDWLPRSAPREAPPREAPPPAAIVLPPKEEAPVPKAMAQPVAEQPSLPTIEAARQVEVLSLDQRRHELQVLAEKVSGCERCPELAQSRTQTVFGVGPLGVELCLVGEAPGADEDTQGEPFVGAAGQLLNRILAACGLAREEVYICNTIKCRPPGNRTPLPLETSNCREYLDRQLELVAPKFICTLGGSAAQRLLETTMPIGKLRGRFHDYRGIPVMVTYHPAYLLPHRAPEKKKDVWEDMKMLIARMGRTIPPQKG